MDEIKEVIWYDMLIINEKIDQAVDCLRSIYIAEKSRKERLKDRLKPFLRVRGNICTRQHLVRKTSVD